ncbi:MAG: galactokinase [Armatimonadota bacterium]|jgi:galactokinase
MDTRTRELRDRARAALRGHLGRRAAIIARAPGRLEVLGGHTDYNEGFVLAVATEQATAIAAARRDDSLVRAWTDCDESEAAFDIRRVDEGPWGRWWDYPAGVIDGLRAEGCVPVGADLAIVSDVPIGGGVSSSAALEVASAIVMSSLAGCEIDPEALALLCQRAENDYVGMRCGIMDQFASVFGRAGHAMWLDCRTRERRLVPMNSEEARFVVCDTNKPRELIDSAYNERRETCEQVAEVLGVRALRDVDEQMLSAAEELLDETQLRRARHVVSENARVQAGADALEAGEMAVLGELLNASHVSLRDDYEVSCAELETMRNAALRSPGCFGARLMGAGFGGCVLALVNADGVDEFAAQVGQQYRAQTGLEPAIFATAPADGAGLIPHESEEDR